MYPEMLVTSTADVCLMSALLLIGVGFILFGKEVEFVFIGMVVIGGVTSITYTNHSQYLQERATLNAFLEGRALECGIFRGESIRVDITKGWVREEGVGFVKGDAIINDIGVCSVIGEPSKEPSSVPYWMVFVSAMAILLALRIATVGALEEKR
jgi:hypothetical protein